MVRFVNIGFGNIINAEKIVTIVSPDGAPIKRLVQTAKEQGRIIDATQGRKTKGVIMTEDSFVVLSALQPDTIARRVQNDRMTLEEKGDIDE